MAQKCFNIKIFLICSFFLILPFKLLSDGIHDRIHHALKEIKMGNPIIIIDDEYRENEGDLIYAAQNITPKKVAFLINNTSGIICLVLENKRIKELELPMMVQENTSKYKTPFTVSIDATEGISTGVSASDRTKTILTAINPQTKPNDLARPGHIFPLSAHPGGIFKRRGHTEGSMEVIKMAGLYPAAVLAELKNEDGTMKKGEQIQKFAKKHNLIVISINDLVIYKNSKIKRP